MLRTIEVRQSTRSLKGHRAGVLQHTIQAPSITPRLLGGGQCGRAVYMNLPTKKYTSDILYVVLYHKKYDISMSQ